ncbi:MAG: hypothetical protein R2856_30315 [Caldilineaceae bacterium]
MKLAYFHTDGSSRVGVVVEDRIFDLSAVAQAAGISVPDSVLGILAGGAAAHSAVQRVIDNATQSLPLSAVTLDPPLQPHDGKLFCLAGNYASHIQEGGGHFAGKDKMTPHFFIKPWTTVVATKQAICIPAVSTFTDWELDWRWSSAAVARYRGGRRGRLHRRLHHLQRHLGAGTGLPPGPRTASR